MGSFKMLLMIDNYDSFTYNIVQYFGELGEDVRVYRNDEITLEQIEALNPDRICISPGPKAPAQAGISVEVLKHFAGKKPILGVCLGHQAIGEAFGGKVIRAKQVMHGKTSLIAHTGVGVFKGLPSPFTVIRYHSLAIERASLPSCLEVTAWTDDGEIMGVRHREYDIEGVQFHPESILSEHGHALLKNFPRALISCARHGVPSVSSCAIIEEGSIMPITPQEALLRCIEHREIFHDEMLYLFRQIMSGEMSPTMIAALTMGLRVKKETIGEIAAAAQVMREFSTKVPMADTTNLLDIVGTGGDGAHTFNISTASMFVAAAAGARVAKHGGRSVSSSSGSADVLDSLGVNINLQPEQIAQSIAQTGIGFMYAPNHHAAMKHAAPVRKRTGRAHHFQYPGPA